MKRTKTLYRTLAAATVLLCLTFALADHKPNHNPPGGGGGGEDPPPTNETVYFIHDNAGCHPASAGKTLNANRDPTSSPRSNHALRGLRDVPLDPRYPNRRLVVASTFDDKSSVWIGLPFPLVAKLPLQFLALY